MSTEYVVTTHHTDNSVTRVWFGNDIVAAQAYWRAHREMARASGGSLGIGMDIRIPDGADRCPACLGSGSVVTRYGGEDGMFPDEDACPRCHGRGHLAKDAA